MSLLGCLDRFLGLMGGLVVLGVLGVVLVGHGRLRERVNHSKKEYARGDVHISYCENRASPRRP